MKIKMGHDDYWRWDRVKVRFVTRVTVRVRVRVMARIIITCSTSGAAAVLCNCIVINRTRNMSAFNKA